MPAPETSFRAVAFSRDALSSEVLLACHATTDDPPTQVAYLGHYLELLRPKPQAMLIESPYVDRHFLQEYAGYYATTLRPPSSHTTRIHFFSQELTEEGWQSLSVRGVHARADVERELEGNYLGFIVVRPIPSCPIGRTVLRYYDDVASRCYAAAATMHEVHLAGLTLHVRGTPFQQQDQGLGACATTALWAALARVMRADGTRAATPLDVAHAANPSPGNSALVPAPHGLDLEEMQRAVRACGYAPQYISPADRDVFLLAIKAYLRCGIPVVLRYRTPPPQVELHAAAVVGYRASDADEEAPDLNLKVRDFILPATGMSRLFVHDDRLGPYARLVFEDTPAKELAEARKGGFPPAIYVRFDPRRPGFEEFTKPHRLESAIIPAYPKLRLTATGLIEYAADYLPPLRGILGSSRRDDLRFEPFFARGTDYLARLDETGVDAARCAEARRRAFLSRYVGVLRFSVGTEWYLDIVLDGTDVKRQHADAAPVLLIVAADQDVASTLRAGLGQTQALVL